jgi:hypothetical protein
MFPPTDITYVVPTVYAVSSYIAPHIHQINTNLNDLHNYANDIHSELTAHVNPNINSLIDTVAAMDYIIDTYYNTL